MHVVSYDYTWHLLRIFSKTLLRSEGNLSINKGASLHFYDHSQFEDVIFWNSTLGETSNFGRWI